jgi:hypothetical protein
MNPNLPLYMREEWKTFQISSHSSMSGDNVLLKPGEAYDVMNMEGPAIIKNVWFTLSCKDPHYLRKVTLRIYWDYEQEPSVEVPFGDFFGNGFGIRTPYNEARTDYSSVAYWYQNEPHLPFPALPVPEERERIEPVPQFVIPDAIEFEFMNSGITYYMSTYTNGWSKNTAQLFPFEGKGEYIDRSFEVEITGQYDISANYIENDHNGILQLYVDGEPVGFPVDTYAPDPKDDYLLCRNAAKGLIYLGAIKLGPGSHQIRVEVVGKHEESKGYEAIIDCVQVTKSGDRK